ncbi:MAG: hypothetical protein LBV06_03155 [Propionibacteriaceae bacterium]|nr:hypothetical protein [Propionibacteriaceae bacterium]
MELRVPVPRPTIPVVFSNGAVGTFDYTYGHMDIDVEDIAALTLDDVTRTLQIAVKSGDPSYPHCYLDVRIGGADAVFGVDLGYAKWPPRREDPDHDFMTVRVQDGYPDGVDILADFPVAKDLPSARAMLDAVLASASIRVTDLHLGESDGIPDIYVKFHIPGEMTMQEIAFKCQTAIAVLLGVDLRESPLSVYRLLALDQWDSLVGKHETDWFEAKQKMYGMHDPRQQFELALDVASMANLDSGGIIVVGLATEKDSYQRDTVSAVLGTTRLNLSIPQLRTVIDNLIYPALQRLDVTVFRKDGREVLGILIPPQNASRLPFLVQGALIDSKKKYGAGFTWVTRNGDGKQLISVQAVHRALQESKHK